MKYREFKCAVCGEVTIDRSPGQRKKYCSDQCTQVQYRRNHGVGVNAVTPSCIYNKEVGCMIHKCGSCGWNPKVEQKRKEALIYG